MSVLDHPYQKYTFPWSPDPFAERWGIFIREELFLLSNFRLRQRLLFIVSFLHLINLIFIIFKELNRHKINQELLNYSVF